MGDKAEREAGATLELLYSRLINLYSVDIDPFPETVRSSYGQDINLIENGSWNERIIFHIPGYTSKHLILPKKVHEHPIIEYAFRSFLVYQIETKSSFDGVVELANAIGLIPVKINNTNDNSVTEMIYEWIKSIY